MDDDVIFEEVREILTFVVLTNQGSGTESQSSIKPGCRSLLSVACLISESVTQSPSMEGNVLACHLYL